MKDTRFSIGALTLDHGHARRGKITPTYNAWRGMIERCENPKHIGFKYYGARGITVCKRWRIFNNFLADMGPKPEPTRRYNIERKNTNGNYTPRNCEWATTRKNRLNQRPYDESARTLKGWATRRANGWTNPRDSKGRFL